MILWCDQIILDSISGKRVETLKGRCPSEKEFCTFVQMKNDLEVDFKAESHLFSPELI